MQTPATGLRRFLAERAPEACAELRKEEAQLVARLAVIRQDLAWAEMLNALATQHPALHLMEEAA